MCGPSSGLKAINTNIQNFSSQLTSEAGTVFGDSSSVFNNILSSMQGIVAGGPEQQGFTSTELNAMNTQADQGGATLTRNLKGAAIASGGGTAVTDPGATIAATDNAEQSGTAQVAGAKNQITQNNYQTGNQNFFAASNMEEQAPNALGAAAGFNSTAGSEQELAGASEQNINTQSSWWKDPVMKAGAAAAQFIPYVGPYVSAAIKTMDANYNQIQGEDEASDNQAFSNSFSSNNSQSNMTSTPEDMGNNQGFTGSTSLGNSFGQPQ
jgi:hypothetical protein